MAEPNNVRLHYQVYRKRWRMDRGNEPHPPKLHQDFPTREAATVEKARLAMLHPDDTLVATITPIPAPRQVALRPEKIGPGHPQWQGHYRLTA